MPKIKVDITYTRPDPSVQFWLGGDDPIYMQYVIEHYITPGKIVGEYVTHVSPLEKVFTRIFDSHASWLAFRDDPNRSYVNIDRETYCVDHNITWSRTETEIPD